MNYFERIVFCFTMLAFWLYLTTSTWAGTVTGIMEMKDGTPMAGGMVIVFKGDAGPPPLLSDNSREPEFVSELNSEGAFKIKLLEGLYYFGAVQWRDGRGPGKPVKGDNFFLMLNTPIKVPAEGLINLGVLSKGETIR